MGQMVARLAGHFITYANVKSQCSIHPKLTLCCMSTIFQLKKRKEFLFGNDVNVLEIQR